MGLKWIPSNQFAIVLPKPVAPSTGKVIAADEFLLAIAWWATASKKELGAVRIQDNVYIMYPKTTVNAILEFLNPPIEFWKFQANGALAEGSDCDDYARYRHTIARLLLPDCAVFSVDGRKPGKTSHRFNGILVKEGSFMWIGDRPQWNPDGDWSTYDNIEA